MMGCVGEAVDVRCVVFFRARTCCVLNHLAHTHSQFVTPPYPHLALLLLQVLNTMGGVVWREKLEEAVSAADASSSALVSDFMAGDVPLEGFVSKHVEQRIQHHVLDLKRQAAETLLAVGPTSSAGGAAGAAAGGG